MVAVTMRSEENLTTGSPTIARWRKRFDDPDADQRNAEAALDAFGFLRDQLCGVYGVTAQNAEVVVRSGPAAECVLRFARSLE